MKPRFVAVTLFAAAALIPNARAAAQSESGSCPEEDPRVRAQLEELLQSDDRMSQREILDLTAVASEPLRLLREPDDHRVCKRLGQEIPEAYKVKGDNARYFAVFYTVGDRYIVAVRSAPFRDKKPRTRRPDQTITFDSEFRKIAGIIVPW